MKTKLIFSIIASFLISSQVFANNSENKNKTTSSSNNISLSEQIKNNLNYPDFAMNVMRTDEVYLEFTVTEDSLLIVENADTENPHLKAYVMKQLNNMKLMVDQSTMNKNFSIRLIFE